MNKSEYLTSNEIAKRLRIDIATVPHIAQKYAIKVDRTNGYHHIKYPIEEIRKYLSLGWPNSQNFQFISNSELDRYTNPIQIKSDCILISGDNHIPLHDPIVMDHALKLCKKWKCRDVVFTGDLVEQDAFKSFFDHLEGMNWNYEKDKFKDCMNVFLKYFDKIFWLVGNHELRMWKKLEGSGSIEDSFNIFLKWEQSGKVQISNYPWAVVNHSWFVCHPKSYSAIQARNPYFLASKYCIELLEKGESPNGQYGLIGFHGHLGGMGTDVSSRFQVADGMGMFDPDLFEYYRMKITKSPAWRQGFYILRNNYLYAFPEDSVDWEWWLK